uniref:Uncharacterized protein n=1 Tax=Rhizophora mucronata TaxID=61149 RepID=A0A2P2KZE4_RHIMU
MLISLHSLASINNNQSLLTPQPNPLTKEFSLLRMPIPTIDQINHNYSRRCFYEPRASI